MPSCEGSIQEPKRAIASYSESAAGGFPAEGDKRMDETLWSLMTIVGPAILLALLVWLAMRSRRRAGQATDTTARTEQATHDNYAAEEQRRREGTDDL